MRINPVYRSSCPNVNNNPGFGIVAIRPKDLPGLNVNAQREVSYPRTFSNDVLNVVMARHDLFSTYTGQSVTNALLKDIRKTQQEAVQYKNDAIEFMKNRTKTYIRPDGSFLKETYYESGSPRSQVLSEDGENSRTYAFNTPDGKKDNIIKFKDKKLIEAYFFSRTMETEKINRATYREDGTLQSFEVGFKNNGCGVSTWDKVFVYDDENNLKEAALDVVRDDNKGISTMKSYICPDSDNDEFIDRYVGKRTVHDDGEIEYENVFYFGGKKYWRFYHTQTLENKNEFAPIFGRPLGYD